MRNSSGNRYDGYLLATRNGLLLATEDESILRLGDYYFHVPYTG